MSTMPGNSCSMQRWGDLQVTLLAHSISRLARQLAYLHSLANGNSQAAGSVWGHVQHFAPLCPTTVRSQCCKGAFMTLTA